MNPWPVYQRRFFTPLGYVAVALVIAALIAAGLASAPFVLEMTAPLR